MAHLRDATRRCDTPLCRSLATKGLYSNRNAHMGTYCGKHARSALLARQRYEDDDSGARVTEAQSRARVREEMTE